MLAAYSFAAPTHGACAPGIRIARVFLLPTGKESENMNLSIKNELQAAGLRMVYDYIDKDPEQNLPRVVELIDRLVPSGGVDGQLRAIRSALADPQSNWYRFAMDLFTNVDRGVRRAAFENLAINATLMGISTHDELEREHDCNVPWAILMDPTSACNLHCTGC